jgi:hypothetical protein
MQEIESEDDGLDDEVDADADEEHEHEAEDAVPDEPTVKNAAAPPTAPKDTERQLSKKELKKKELAELDAVLAELGLGTPANSTQDESNGKSRPVSFSTKLSFTKNYMHTEQTQSGCVDALMVGHVCSRFTTFVG